MATEKELLAKDLSRKAPMRLHESQVRYMPWEVMDSPRRDVISDDKTGPDTKTSPRKGIDPNAS